MGFFVLIALKIRGGKDGIIGTNEKCESRRGNFSVCHWSYFDNPRLSYLASFSVGFWINRGGNYTYCSIWILTLKRIYAEGLQQRT
jgi:hypothetical protein